MLKNEVMAMYAMGDCDGLLFNDERIEVITLDDMDEDGYEPYYEPKWYDKPESKGKFVWFWNEGKENAKRIRRFRSRGEKWYYDEHGHQFSCAKPLTSSEAADILICDKSSEACYG